MNPVNIEIRILSRQPIVDTTSGQTLVPAGTCGIVTAYEIDAGDPAYIPVRGVPDKRLTRRIKLWVTFSGFGSFCVMYPEHVDFQGKEDLLKLLLVGQEIVQVSGLTPAPRFQQVVAYEPFAVTLHTAEVKITFGVDNTSGLLDIEIEACE